MCQEGRALCRGGGVLHRAHDADFPDSDTLPETVFRAFVDKGARWVDTLLSDGRTVLVHCHAGINRSVATIVEYAVQHRGWSFENAVAYVRARNAEVRGGTPALINPLFGRLLRDR